jgi:hypothetical protein
MQSSPSFRIPADDRHGEQQYRIVGRNVQFSKDGVHWRTLAAEDVDLHLRLRTPLAPWLEAHLAPLRRASQSQSFSGSERRNITWQQR